MITLLLLILILSLLIFVHELGHFLLAKKAKVHIYEFALGMGPIIWSKEGKDGVLYSLRLFPIGGFCSIAGEVYEDDTEIPKEKFMCNRPWIQRVLIIISGVVFNFILALFILVISGLIWGNVDTKPIIAELVDKYPMHASGIEVGDKVLEINDFKTNSWERLSVALNLKNENKYYTFKVKKSDGTKKTYKVEPLIEKDKDGNEVPVFGFMAESTVEKGLLASIKLSFVKFGRTIEQMWLVIINLFAGNISLNALSGPVGMYAMVGESSSYGIQSILFLTALLSINLGFINILPIPAFDGGRLLFLLIEKITGKPINLKIENWAHTIGFILLLGLMLLITIKDIINLF